MDGRGAPIDDSRRTGKLPEGGGQDERAVFGVRTAAARRVEVGGLGRLGLAARVEDQRVHVGQSEAARDERHGQQKGIEPAQQTTRHARV